MRREWTNHEQARAFELRDKGLSYGTIAYVMKSRSADAVAAHLRYWRQKYLDQ